MSCNGGLALRRVKEGQPEQCVGEIMFCGFRPQHIAHDRTIKYSIWPRNPISDTLLRLSPTSHALIEPGTRHPSEFRADRRVGTDIHHPESRSAFRH
jgi:hypothetical protein